MLPPLLRRLHAAYHGSFKELGGGPKVWLLKVSVYNRLVQECDSLPPYDDTFDGPFYEFRRRGLLFNAPIIVMDESAVAAPICYRGADGELHIVVEVPA
jgi:hypothetical protein